MAIQQQLHTVDSVWQLSSAPEYVDKRLYLIDGELYVMSGPGGVHGRLAIMIGALIWFFVQEHDLGEVTGETGYYAADNRSTLLRPDVAFISKARAPVPFPEKFIPLMPDLAVEIASPSDSLAQLRRKAAIYLDNGSSLVWIVLPAENGVDVCRSADGARLDIEFVPADGLLSGEDVLPGFELELRRLFPSPAAN